MFFVGATGQLLTLILTVSIPFMMLVTGNSKVEHHRKQATLNVEHFNHFEIKSVDKTNVTDLDDVIEYKNYPEIYNIVTRVIKIPPNIFRVNWKNIHLENIGNKAPPVSVSFLF